MLLSTSSLFLLFWVQEQWHEQERFASIATGKLNAFAALEVSNTAMINTIDIEEHSITLYLKDKSLLPNGYQWEEMNREFSNEGMFYDIISLTKTDTGWKLVAVSDREEAEIVARQTEAKQIGKEITANKKSNKQKLNGSFSLFDKFVESPYQHAFLQLNQLAYFHYQDQLTKYILGQISPPPEAVYFI